MRHEGIRRAVWWFFLLIFMASGLWLAYYLYMTHSSDAMLKQLTAKVEANREKSTAVELLQPVTTMRETVPQTETKQRVSQSVNSILPEYRELAKQNVDMTGWITIEDTVVDYPVMYTPGEPQKYLDMNFENGYSFSGLPFMDVRSNPQSPQQNTILYAHNMKTGQMFAPLLEYLKPEYVRDNPYVMFDTLEQHGTYQILAVLQIRLDRMDAPNMYCYQIFDTQNDEDVYSLNQYLAEYAQAVYGTAVQGDSILTLSTCQRLESVDRLVIMARKLL